MLKKIVLFALVMFPVIAFAQEQKIAYVNSMEVLTSMPEYKQMQDSLTKSANEFQAELKNMTDEYTKKLSDYVNQQDSLNESIKSRRQNELQELQQRTESFQQYAGQQQDAMQQRLSAPIYDKFLKGVSDVGKENNFLYVIDNQAIRYSSPSAVDATPLIKKKLGIQ